MFEYRRWMLVVLFIIGIIFLQGCKATPMLTKGFDQVDMVTIRINKDVNQEYELKLDKDRELLKKIYESVKTTNTRTKTKPDSGEEQTSDPYFTISFDYKDGSKDMIYATETGKFIFKRLAGNGWTGGSNSKLIGLVQEAKGIAQPKAIEQKRFQKHARRTVPLSSPLSFY